MKGVILMFAMSCVGLRMLTLQPMIKVTGSFGGMEGANALCRASAEAGFSNPNTTWIAMLDYPSLTLNTVLDAFGAAVYPYRDSLNLSNVICQTSMFELNSIVGSLGGAVDHWTGRSDLGTCSGWNSLIGGGGSGSGTIPSKFLVLGSARCNKALTLVCLEVPVTQRLAPPIRVFATSSKHLGNFGGIAQADAICATRAAAGSLTRSVPGRWYAWLSDRNVSLQTRLESTMSSLGIRTMSATSPGSTIGLMYSGEAELTDIQAYYRDENGAIPTSPFVWTGSTASGAHSQEDCLNWVHPGLMGAVGEFEEPFSDGSQPCYSALSLLCAHYVCPIVTATTGTMLNTSSVVTTVSMYADVAWTVVRCVVTLGPYNISYTNAQFWGLALGNSSTFAVVETRRAAASTTAVLTASGMATNRSFGVTCAARFNSYTALSWPVDAGSAILPSPGIILPQPNVTNSGINFFVLTGSNLPMRIQCVATVILPSSTDFFWRPGRYGSTALLVEVYSTGPAPVNFAIRGLLSYTNYTISCSQYVVAQGINTAYPIFYLSGVRTLPKCRDTPNACDPTACVDSLTNGSFQCSPYVDGGFHLTGTPSPPNCRRNNGTANFLNLTSTNSQNISFCFRIGASADRTKIRNDVSFFYGPLTSPRRFRCENLSFAPSSMNDTVIASCLTRVGMGAGLFVGFLYNNVFYRGIETLSYPPPIILPGTLRLANSSTGSSSLTLDDFNSALVAFQVLNVQPLQELQVYYGPDFDPMRYDCALRSAANSSTVVCSTDAGSDYFLDGYVFSLDCFDQATTGADKLFFLPGRPTVVNVTSPACTQVGNGISNCPTQGHTALSVAILTISGTSFDTLDRNTFKVSIDGDKPCPVVSLAQTGNNFVATCELPPGVGFRLNLIILGTLFYSTPVHLVSYAPPSITSICGCDRGCGDDNVTSVANCVQDGSQTLQIFGDNFGRSNAIVLIAGVPCQSVTHKPETPHNHLKCVLPPNSQNDCPVLVIQGNGVANLAITARVSYQQCAKGTFQLRSVTGCQNCSAGTFSETEGVTQCAQCSPGTMQPLEGASMCQNCPYGQYQELSGMENCTNCSVGFFSTTLGRSACEFCLPGTVAPEEGMSTCDQCQPGSYQSLPFQMTCVECELGRFQINSGGIECLLCAPGTMTNDTGMSECLDCPKGRYQPAEGQHFCGPCAAGKHASNTRTKECDLCPPHNRAGIEGEIDCCECPKGTDQEIPGQAVCNLCAAGRYGPLPGEECLKCPPDSVSNGTGSFGCTKCPVGAAAQEDKCICRYGFAWDGFACSLCSPGEDCQDYGIVKTNTTALAGFVKVGNGLFQKCLVAGYCPGGELRCAENREGPLCQSCIHGYREHSGFVTCEPCGSIPVSMANIVGVGIACVVVMVFLYFAVVRSGMRALAPPNLTKPAPWWESPVITSPKATMLPTQEFRLPDTMSNQRKSFITFIQLSSSASALSTVTMPPTFRDFLSAVDVLNMNFIPWSQVGCVEPYRMITRVWLSALAPFVLLPIASFFLVLGLWFQDCWAQRKATKGLPVAHNLRVATKARTAMRRYKAVFAKVTIFTIFLVYPAVSRQIFGYFRCVEILQDGQPSIWVLQESFREQCGDAAWNANLGWVIFMLLLYPIGVPVLFGYTLFKFRSRFHEGYVRYCLGFIYEGYLPQFWFWELIDTVHKLLIAAIMSLVSVNAQLTVATAVLGAYLALLLWINPYLRESDNQFAFMIQAVMYLMLLAILSLQKVGTTLGSDEDLLMSMLLLTLFCAVIVHLLFRMGQYFRKRKEVVLGVLRNLTTKDSRASLRGEEGRASSPVDEEETNSEGAEEGRTTNAEKTRPMSPASS